MPGVCCGCNAPGRAKCNSKHEERQSETCQAFVSVLVASLGSLTLGYAMGYPSSALIELTDASKLQQPADYAFAKGSPTSDLFGALMPIGALFGSPIGGLMADKTGRKSVLAASGIPNFLGWLVIVLSYYSRSAWTFKLLILIGRFLTGFASGCLTSAVPLYAAEIAGYRRRGLFGTFYQLSVCVGIFLSYAVGTIPNFSYIHSAAIVGGLIIVFETLTIVLLHESPRWLIYKGRDTSAEKTLRRLRHSQEIAKEEAEAIKNLLQRSPKLSITRKLCQLRQRHLYMPLILSLMLIFFHQFSGINVIIFYAATIFQTAGISHARETALFAVGILQIIATGISSVLVDLAGRKVLLVFGSIGMAISSAGLGAHFFITRPAFCVNISNNATALLTASCNPQFAPLAISSLIGFGFAFSIGWRALPFIVMAELFPLRLRGILGGIGSCSLWFYATIITGFYQDYEQAVQPYIAWWSFAFISFLGTFFVIIFIPETKGKTLEEIESYFKKSKHKLISDTDSIFLNIQELEYTIMKETTV